MKHNQNTYSAIIPLSSSMLAMILYLVGIGRYWSILLICFYYFIEAVLAYKMAKQDVIKPALWPLLIMAIMFDMYLVRPSKLLILNNVFIALALFVVIELIINKYIIAFIGKASKDNYFGCCPNCKYANKQLTNKCVNCGYSSISLETKQDVSITAATKVSKTMNNSCHGLLSSIPTKCILLLNIEKDEELVGSLRIFPERGIYLNGTKLLVKYLIVSTKRLILLDYHFYYSGWTYRQNIDVNNIIKISIVNKHHHNKTVPMLIFEVDDNIYELYYSPFESATSKLEDLVDCLRLYNKGIQTTS